MKPVLCLLTAIACLIIFSSSGQQGDDTWIRINLLGYKPSSPKMAVWCSKKNAVIKKFELVDAATHKTVLSAPAGKAFGAYGPFLQTYRLDFSSFKKQGRYYLRVNKVKSPEFSINENVYNGTADFCLRYMRQQRTGFNPFLKDSCHTRDGYVLYGEKAGIKDSTHIDVVGGWHDASDYLQYATTSANAAYHLFMSYRDFPYAFTDAHKDNGLEGKNGQPDVLDEARWGLQWLLKMHPSPGQMYNQIADDRDHMGMRIPGQDSFYGRGAQRPVYFISGEPQQRGKFMNATTGTSSTAAKMAAVFAIAHTLYEKDSLFRATDKRKIYYDKAMSALHFAQKKPGVTQTASVKSPYIYAEENWVDDMELANAAIHEMVLSSKGGGDNGYYLVNAIDYAKKEKITPWLGKDTAAHYQWYPFINIGHYEVARQMLQGNHAPKAGYVKPYIENFPKNKDTIIGFYRQGIENVWTRARQNAFYRGIPFIWCSNNLTTSFAIQCYWYRKLTGNKQFEALEQANIDWLFGCNPWGTSMIYGLPSWGDTPVDPHSAFTHIGKYPIDGGLVDGPVYTSIYKNLIGIKLYEPDEYEAFQSELAVYHDDYGDYSTNEPTMDGTASLIYLLASQEVKNRTQHPSFSKNRTTSYGGVIRGDTNKKRIALVFTGDEYADGGNFILESLQKEKLKASFFLTGKFYRNPVYKSLIEKLKNAGHYIGAHSNEHLLYCDWAKRDSLLVDEQTFKKDLLGNYEEMKKYGILKTKAPFFLPPYEWYNDTISKWTKELGLQLVNFTPGTLTHADYTIPTEKNYRSSDVIFESIYRYEQGRPAGLSGFIMLMHIGTYPERKDKFYHRLPELMRFLKNKGYDLVTVKELLQD